MRNKKLFFIIGIGVLALACRLLIYLAAVESVPVSSAEATAALTAQDITNHTLPLSQWGQNGAGFLAVVFNLLLIPLFGSHPSVVRLSPMLLSIIFGWISFLLASRLFGARAGYLTLLLLLVPVPVLGLYGALATPGNMLLAITLGSLALLILTKILYVPANKRAWWKYCLLGLVSGCALWAHYAAAAYVVAVLLLIILRDGLFFLRYKFWLAVLMFFIGTLQLWTGCNNDNSHVFTASPNGMNLLHFLENARALFSISIQFPLGLKSLLYTENAAFIALPAWWTVMISTVCVFLLAAALEFQTARHSITPQRHIRENGGKALLLALVATSLLLFCLNSRAQWCHVNNLAPLLSAFPILLALGLVKIRQRSRFLCGTLLVLLIVTWAWGNRMVLRTWQDKQTVGRQMNLPDTAPLLEYLAEQKIQHAYTHADLANRLVFETGGKLICADQFAQSDHTGRALAVQTAKRVAYIDYTTMQLPAYFESALKESGGRWNRQSGYGFTMFFDFVPPWGAKQLREISADNWELNASTNIISTANLVDGRLDTYWSTDSLQAPGQWLRIDLGQPEEIAMVRFELGQRNQAYPRGYRLETSLDSQSWTCQLELSDFAHNLFWEDNQPRLWNHDNFYTASFAPVKARHIKITLTAKDDTSSWSLAEVRIFGPDQE